MITLYDMPISGNCYKIRLLLSFLQLPYQRISIDLKARQQKTPEFLAINTFGQVPVLVDGDIIIRDSHAILVYLARAYGGQQWLPEDAQGLALVTQWLSNSANEISNGLAAARAYHLLNRTEIDIERAQARAINILTLLNQHLLQRKWLELERPTIADIACYPYISVAHEGQIDLIHFPNILAWLERVKQLPNYVAMNSAN